MSMDLVESMAWMLWFVCDVFIRALARFWRAACKFSNARVMRMLVRGGRLSLVGLGRAKSSFVRTAMSSRAVLPPWPPMGLN